MIKEIIMAAPRGFCAGVDRAITIVEKALEVYGSPVYVRHEIVHNQTVIDNLKEKGAIFVETLDEISNPNAVVIFSAHGIPPQVRTDAINRGFTVIDATCPLVTKVHLEAVRYHKEGYSIFIVGHKGHQEVIGTMGEAPMQLIETAEEARNIQPKNNQKIAVITQTTLSIDDTAEIISILKERFPAIKTPPAQDICYATQNRQDAVKELAKETSLILVVGAHNSSNSNRLVETAIRYGCESHLVAKAAVLNKNWLHNHQSIGITSGASVPEKLVQELIETIKKDSPEATVLTLETKKENMKFPLPKFPEKD